MDPLDIIIQDIEVALKSIDKKDYGFINIIGNRVLSNIMFFDDKSSFLSGIFLKEISLTLIRTQSVENFDEIISLSNESIESLKKLVEKHENDYSKYWKIYYNFEKKTRCYLQNESENESYNENFEYSDIVIEKMFELIKENKDYLFKEKSLFLHGIHNELARTLNNFGGSLRSYMVGNAIKVLTYLFNYANYESLSIKNEFDSEALKKKIIPYIDELIDIYSNIKEDKDFIDKISILILNVIIEWRKYFIFYLEPSPKSIKEERKIDLPPESRKKIGNLITKALEKEMK